MDIYNVTKIVDDGKIVSITTVGESVIQLPEGVHLITVGGRPDGSVVSVNVDLFGG